MKEAVQGSKNDQIMRLLVEVRAKGGLPADQVDQILRQINLDS